MNDKGIGFNRTIFLRWLDAAADLRAQTDDLLFLRNGLKDVLGQDITGVDAIRKSIDVIVNIWHKSAEIDDGLHTQALEFLPQITVAERIWLHYGLTLLYYPFFRQTAAILGQFARTGEPITRQAVKGRLSAEIGHLGSLNRSAERVIASLVDWGLLLHQKKENVYIPKIKAIKTDNLKVQNWLLACALLAHPANELPFSDLIRSPELFPFDLSITIDSLRPDPRFSIHKQGMWDMISLHAQVETGKS
jgi:hypothetical protein